MKSLNHTLIIVLFLFTSCQNPEQVKMQTKSIGTDKDEDAKKERNDVFVERGKHSSNFLYLNYWIGMDSIEFEVITDSLANTKRGDYFNRNAVGELIILKDTFRLSPLFDNGRLNGIKLINHRTGFGMVEPVLELYCGKYGNYKVEKPKLSKYVRKNGDYWLKTKDEDGTYFRFIQYIWDRDEFMISILNKYDIFPDRFGDYYFPLLTTFEISYVSKASFKSELSKEILDKKRKEIEENIKKKKAQNLI